MSSKSSSRVFGRYALRTPAYDTLGIRNVYNDPAPQWFFGIGGWFTMNTGDTNQFNRDEFQIVDTGRWTRGRHDLAIGADYTYGRGDIVNNFRGNGRCTFNNAAGYAGNAMSDFLLGNFLQFEQGVGEYKNTRLHYVSAFVQDTFRMSSRLTLNLGVRWDPYIPYTDANDRIGAYRPGVQSQVYPNAPTGAVYPGDPGVEAGTYGATWWNFGPRLAALANWSVTGILTLQSGLGFSVASGVDNARVGNTSQRADIVGEPELSSDRPTAERITRWFDTSAFRPNALGTFGTSRRNNVRGPGYAVLDVGLFKTFNLSNRYRVQFRAEAFNALNRATFGLPNSTRTSAAFGRITTAGAPRILQFALRTWF